MRLRGLTLTDYEPTGRIVRGDPEWISPSTGITIVAPQHLAQPLPPPGGTASARSTDPPTAHEAARTARRTAGSDAWLVLRAHLAAGDDGLTGEELAAATGRPHESIGPRRPRLVREGLLFAPPGFTRPNSRGNKAQVFVITAAGRQAAEESA